MISERGSTLAGELVGLAIIGLALFILISGISTSSAGVVLVDRRVHVEALACRQLEAIKAAPYQVNPTLVPYPSAGGLTGYTAMVEVSYWISPTGLFTDTLPEQDSGLQKVTVRVAPVADTSEVLYTLEGYKAVR